MKTLCLGGSFNPIHHGHLICARAVAEAKCFDRVMLIPSCVPPHKPQHDQLAAATDRLEMCRLAVEKAKNITSDASNRHPVQFEVSDIELQRTGASYTIDTVRKFKQNGWTEVNWLIGADMLNYLPKWHQAAALLDEVNFLIVARPGVSIDWNALPPSFSILKKNVVEAPLIQISASDIRSRVKEGRSIEFLTPPKVVQYISDRWLYR